MTRLIGSYENVILPEWVRSPADEASRMNASRLATRAMSYWLFSVTLPPGLSLPVMAWCP